MQDVWVLIIGFVQLKTFLVHPKIKKSIIIYPHAGFSIVKKR